MNVVGGNLNRPLSMADMDKALEDIELLLKEHWSVFHAFMITQPDLCFIENGKAVPSSNSNCVIPKRSQ